MVRYTYCGYLHIYLLGPQARPWRKSSYILGWHWEEFCQGYRPIKRRGIKKLTILVKPTVYYWRGENSITIPFEFFKSTIGSKKTSESCGRDLLLKKGWLVLCPLSANTDLLFLHACIVKVIKWGIHITKLSMCLFTHKLSPIWKTKMAVMAVLILFRIRW